MKHFYQASLRHESGHYMTWRVWTWCESSCYSRAPGLNPAEDLTSSKSDWSKSKEAVRGCAWVVSCGGVQQVTHCMEPGRYVCVLPFTIFNNSSIRKVWSGVLSPSLSCLWSWTHISYLQCSCLIQRVRGKLASNHPAPARLCCCLTEPWPWPVSAAWVGPSVQAARRTLSVDSAL